MSIEKEVSRLECAAAGDLKKYRAAGEPQKVNQALEQVANLKRRLDALPNG